jgi:hypothetical protein
MYVLQGPQLVDVSIDQVKGNDGTSPGFAAIAATCLSTGT